MCSSCPRIARTMSKIVHGVSSRWLDMRQHGAPQPPNSPLVFVGPRNEHDGPRTLWTRTTIPLRHTFELRLHVPWTDGPQNPSTVFRERTVSVLGPWVSSIRVFPRKPSPFIGWFRPGVVNRKTLGERFPTALLCLSVGRLPTG